MSISDEVGKTLTGDCISLSTVDIPVDGESEGDCGEDEALLEFF
jgi:hypothetical protein